MNWQRERHALKRSRERTILKSIDGHEKSLAKKAFDERVGIITSATSPITGISAEHKDYHSLTTAGYSRRDLSSSAVNERWERFWSPGGLYGRALY